MTSSKDSTSNGFAGRSDLVLTIAPPIETAKTPSQAGGVFILYTGPLLCCYGVKRTTCEVAESTRKSWPPKQ